MGYTDLQANQTISFNNLQSGVSEGYFAAKTTIPVSLKQITKTEANTYVYINTSLPSYAGKASNQLVTKNDLSGITSTSPYIMYGVAGASGYKSADGGNTFTALSGLPSLTWTAIAGDATGLYIAAISYSQINTVYISTNGGSSFTSTTLSFIVPSCYPTGVSMSANGQYVAVSGIAASRAIVFVSSNYGASFSFGYGDSTTYDMYNVPSGKVSVSGNGQYMTAIFAYNVNPPFPNVDRPWSFRVYSSNYGASFTKSGGSEFSAFSDIALSYTGQYQFLTVDWLKPGFFGSDGVKAYVSNNYGSSFTEQFSNTTAYYLGGRHHCGFISATISDDGKTMVGATNEEAYVNLSQPGLAPLVIASSNYGSSFTLTQGYTGSRGIAGGNIITSGITNNYIAMMLYNIGQFNYSVDGGVTFIPAAIGGYNWNQVYRKAYVYTTTTTSTTAIPIYYYYRYDLDAYCNPYNATLYYSYNIYSNGYYNIGGTVYELTAEPAAYTTLQITSATPASCTPILPYSYTLYYDYNDTLPRVIGFTVSEDACTATNSFTVYSSYSSITTGTTLYYDAYGTTPIDANSSSTPSQNYYSISGLIVQFSDTYTIGSTTPCPGDYYYIADKYYGDGTCGLIAANVIVYSTFSVPFLTWACGDTGYIYFITGAASPGSYDAQLTVTRFDCTEGC